MKTVKKAFLFPYTFVLMNWAPVVGLYYFMRGNAQGIWNPVTMKRTLEKIG
jgi:hypothetical protein